MNSQQSRRLKCLLNEQKDQRKMYIIQLKKAIKDFCHLLQPVLKPPPPLLK